MKLDLTSLEKALVSLSEAITSTTDTKFMASLSASQRRTMRAGVIQNFEFTYEISWKMLRRQLKNEEGDNEVTRLSRKDLYRLAAQKGLINDPECWFVFHQGRNETSHTYDEKTANDIYLLVLDFLPVAEKLFKELAVR